MRCLVVVTVLSLISPSVTFAGDRNDIIKFDETWTNPLSPADQLTELKKAFTFGGKPLHPEAIRELVNVKAGNLPGKIAVNVPIAYCARSNFHAYTVNKANSWLTSTEGPRHSMQPWFAYKYLGTLANGLHVLHTADNGGGIGRFEGLLLLESTLDYEYDQDGKRREIFVLKRRGEYDIGDRFSGAVTVDHEHNVILVEPGEQEKRAGDRKPMRIELN